MPKDYIAEICSKCRYYKTTCYYEAGDSETKIPCEALNELMRLDISYNNLYETLKFYERKNLER